MKLLYYVMFAHVKFVYSGVDVVKKINSPNLKLLLDIFHLQHICGNITKNIEELLAYTGKLNSTARNILQYAKCTKVTLISFL